MLPDREDATYVYQIHLSKVDSFIYKPREKRTASHEQEGDSSSRYYSILENRVTIICESRPWY